jgi:TetR/AcrR family fatty acid metabolism transcriptional regulator
MREFSAAGFAEYLDIIKHTLEEGQRSGAIRSDVKAVVAAKIIYGSLDEMVTNWVLSDRSYPLVPLAAEVIKIYLGGIRAK